MNFRFIYIFFMCLLLAAGIKSSMGQPVNLPLDHWIYPFLERLELRGALPTVYYRSIPLFRSEIANLIQTADIKAKTCAVTLSPAELALLEKAKGEFIGELQGKNIEVDPAEHEPHIFKWKERKSYFYADGYLREEANAQKKDTYKTWNNVYYTSAGGIIRGVIEGKIGFYLDFRNTLIKGQDSLIENFSTSRGLPVAVSGGNATTTQASAYLTYQGTWGDVLVGRDNLNWGPAYRNSLSLSRKGLVFDQIRLNLRYKRFMFTSVHGILHNDIDQKNIAAHRLEVRLTPSVLIGASESVIYGRRGWKLIYLNPIMPYHIAEQHAGDKDNNTISFDFHIRYPRNLKIYGEWLIDDFSLSENWATFYGNKFAFVFGGCWANPFRISDTDMRFEYTRINPFVYTHHDPINLYTNYNRILGSQMGPNSGSMYLEVGRQINRPFRIYFSYEQRRKGKGDVNTPHRPEDGTQKNYLKGIVESLNIFRGGFTYEIIRDLYLSFDYSYIRASNEALVQDAANTNNLFDLMIYFNY